MVEKNNHFISQKNAVENYLNALLSEPSSVMVEGESIHQFTATETLYHSVLTEIENAEGHMKAPRWATEYFSCLPITVADITLFVPLRQVRMVLPLTEDIQPLDELPQWISGTVNNLSKQIKVIDMRKIAYQEIDPIEEPEKMVVPSQLVVINDGKWGLSCDSVGKVQQLSQNEIRWRGRNFTRRWISGLSMKHQLAIIDIKRIEFAMALEYSLV